MSRDRPGHVEIRPAAERDRRALERLAQLDDGRAPAGQALVALVDGELVAALPLDGGRAIANPFWPTAALVELLQLRAAQLEGTGERRGLRARMPLRARTA